MLSAWNQFFRIGLLVLYVHDISDIFVDTLKMVNYLKVDGKRSFFLSELAFGLCIVSWIYYRLFLYPSKVIRCSMVESRYHGMTEDAAPVAALFDIADESKWAWRVCNLLLCCLQLLHIFWFYLFARIGYRVATESAREASRQEYEGDSSDEDAIDPNHYDAKQ